MYYIDKLGRKTDEEHATYWVAAEYMKKYKSLMKQAKEATIQAAPAEWAINRLRQDEPRACGWVYNY